MQTHGYMMVGYEVDKERMRFVIGEEYELVIGYARKEYSLVFPLMLLGLCFLTLYIAIRFEKR